MTAILEIVATVAVLAMPVALFILTTRGHR